METGAYYRTSDPINNLKIKIKLWRASSSIPISSSDPSANVRNTHDSDEYIFSWQEKIFSRKEIEYYEADRDYVIPIETKYHEDVLKLKKNIASYPQYLFSYVEADSNKPNTSVKPTTSDFIHPILEERENSSALLKSHAGPHSSASRVRPFADGEFGGTLRKRGHIVEYSPTKEFKNRRSQVLGAFQTMYIMADVTKRKQQQPVKEGDSNTEETNENKENESKEEDDNNTDIESPDAVLCIIRYDGKSGLLLIKPDFSGNREPYSLAATSHSDSFEYQIIHCSNQMTEQDRDRDRQTISLIDSQRVNLLRASVGPDFEIPFRDALRLMTVGEILTATDFEYDNLFIQYSWDLPSMWTLAPRCPCSGVTQQCARTLIDNHYVANFSSPLELDAFYNCLSDFSQSVLRAPTLLIHVSSLDSWRRLRTEGYGFVDLPFRAGVHEIEVNCWRPVGKSLFDEMRRFFVGSSPEVEDFNYARIPSSFTGNRLSKLGFRVQSTGTVKIRLNAMLQAGEAGGASAELLKELTGRQNLGFVSDGQAVSQLDHPGLAGMSALSAAVQIVLEGYNKAKEKLTAAREGLPGHVRALMLLASENRQQQQRPGFSSAASAVLSSRMATSNRFNIPDKSGHFYGKKQ